MRAPSATRSTTRQRPRTRAKTRRRTRRLRRRHPIDCRSVSEHSTSPGARCDDFRSLARAPGRTFSERNVRMRVAPGRYPNALVPARLLLAEDDAELRSLLASSLREDGFEVVEVSDGNTLVDRLAD